MEKSNNIEDQAIDQLLKSFIKQQSRPESDCQRFDADLASLYLEQVLTEAETSRYETHLFQCSPCRTSVIALAGLLAQEVPLEMGQTAEEIPLVLAATTQEATTTAKPKISFGQRVKAWFGLLATPRFALPALAAVVLAISIPLLLTQNNKGVPGPAISLNKTLPPASDSPQKVAQDEAPKDGSAVVERVDKTSELSPSRQGVIASSGNSASGRATEGAGGAANAPPTDSDTVVAKDSKQEAKSDNPAEGKGRADESAARAGEPPAVAAPPPPKPAANEKKELGYIDPATTRRVPESEKSAAPTTLKPGNTVGDIAAGGNRPAGATIRPADNQAQVSTRSADSSRRLADKGNSLREERDARKEKSPASASRKLYDKTFFLIDDIWTDQKYSKDKELPVVPVIKDSEVFKGLLEKHSGLQKYFKGFAPNEKVIVVYKGTVYKLLPQDGK